MRIVSLFLSLCLAFVASTSLAGNNDKGYRTPELIVRLDKRLGSGVTARPGEQNVTLAAFHVKARNDDLWIAEFGLVISGNENGRIERLYLLDGLKLIAEKDVSGYDGRFVFYLVSPDDENLVVVSRYVPTTLIIRADISRRPLQGTSEQIAVNFEGGGFWANVENAPRYFGRPGSTRCFPALTNGPVRIRSRRTLSDGITVLGIPIELG